jgi:choline dehydrogenase-like flavoprotein
MMQRTATTPVFPEWRIRGKSARTCDVLVVGGGPAGSTAASLLAEKGWEVVLLEKERHPRFHIGESLLPMNLPLFDRLGVREEIEAIAMMKYGAELNSPHHGWNQTFQFSEALDKSWPYAYQVPRAAFDHILLKNCARKGATVIEECRVTNVEFPAAGGCVVSTTRYWEGAQQPRPSLEGPLSRRRLGAGHLPRRQDEHQAAQPAPRERRALRPFRGVERLPGREEGNISIFWFEHGWFLADPAAGRYHQRGRGLLAALSEIAQDASRGVSMGNESRSARNWHRA